MNSISIAASNTDTTLTFSLPEHFDLDVIQKEEWKNVSFPDGFKTSFAYAEGGILLIQGQGYSNFNDEVFSVTFGSDILNQYLKPQQKYIMIQDWNQYETSSSRARQYFIDQVVKDPRIKAIVFCNTTWTQSLSIKLANKMNIIDLDVHIASSVEDAFFAAKRLIDNEQIVDTQNIQLFSDVESKAESYDQIKPHIQDLLNYLDSIDWKTGQFNRIFKVSSLHPMLPVFDAITMIKSQLDKIFQERNLIEQQLLEHKENLEVLVQKRTQELELSRQKLAQLAIRDELTGAYNRRHFMETLTLDFERAQRLNSELCMIMIDVDHFKSINDTYGHPVGDSVLVQLTKAIQGNFQDIDTLFRIGGEEFALIFPQITNQEAQQAAESILQVIRDTAFIVDEMELSVTVSIGVSMLRGDIKNKRSFIQLVDKALYMAKHNGRNQVQFI